MKDVDREYHEGLLGEIADLKKANQLLHGIVSNREAEIERLRKGIDDYLDNNYASPDSVRPHPCEHGIWFYNACEECIDAHFRALLTPAERPDVEKSSEGQS